MNDNTNDKRNPYINSDGQRELRKSIIAFIDILGFKELVRNAKKEGKSQEVFLNFHQALSTWFNRIDSLHNTIFEMPFIGGKKDKYKIRIFTDCILIGCPISKSGRSYNFIEGCDEFFEMLSTLYLLQAEMVNEGYFVPGTIAVDELYMDDVIIYGNGAIEAYEAETEQAKYPRIILIKSSKSVLAEINKGFEDQQRDNYINNFFYKDRDGQFFLNYLESIKIGEHDYQFVDQLEKHKEIIELKLSEYQDKAHCLEKYL
ncbi:MAG: hypothetical protein ACXW06_06690 [Halobacteriota archaeon]